MSTSLLDCSLRTVKIAPYCSLFFLLSHALHHRASPGQTFHQYPGTVNSWTGIVASYYTVTGGLVLTSLLVLLMSRFIEQWSKEHCPLLLWHLPAAVLRYFALLALLSTFAALPVSSLHVKFSLLLGSLTAGGTIYVFTVLCLSRALSVFLLFLEFLPRFSLFYDALAVSFLLVRHLGHTVPLLHVCFALYWSLAGLHQWIYTYDCKENYCIQIF